MGKQLLIYRSWEMWIKIIWESVSIPPAAKFSARALISPMTAGIPAAGDRQWLLRLIDRHSDAGDGQNLLERASLNVTLAVYDADSDTLYFCEMDT